MEQSLSLRQVIAQVSVSRLTGRQRFLALLLAGLTILLIYRSSDAALSCQLQADGSELCTILIRDQNKEFSYHYEIRRAVGSAPTVLILPGGPGQGAIGDIHTLAMVQLIPENFGVIAIDPRGVGRNDFGPDSTGKLYFTKHVAEDVRAVLQHAGVTQYLIYGESYGTVVATELAHLLSQEPRKIPLPQAVVLSRVVGPGFEDQLSSYNQELHRLANALNARQRSQLQRGLSEIFHTAYFGNTTAFAAGLMQALLFNVEAQRPGPLSNPPNVKRFFERLATAESREAKAAIANDPVYQMLVHAYSSYASEFKMQPAVQRNYGMAEWIKCRELSSTGEEARIGFDFQKLSFTLLQSDCQAKKILRSLPYEPERLAITGIPMIYLQGDIDPVTALSGAYKHFLEQKSKDKIFVTLKGFAHVGSLGLWPCRQGLWEAFSLGAHATAKHLEACHDDQLQVQSL